MPYLNLSAGKIWYEQHGTGPDLILLHNGFDSSRTWEQLLPALSKKNRVTVYDRLGYGRSDTTRTPEGDVVADGAAELKELFSLLKINKAVLIGHCLGAAIALLFAADHPDRIRSVVAESCGFYADRDTLRKCDLIYVPWEELPDQTRLQLIHMHGEERAEQFWRAGCGYRGGYVMLEGYDLRPRLEQIKCPVTIIAGETDFLFPIEHAKNGFAALPNANLYFLPGIGHDPHQEAPDNYLQLLQK